MHIANAIAANVTVVCSVGNDYTDVERYPACFNGVIGVGAVDNEKDLTGYTNESKALDIVAPAGDDGFGQMYILRPTTTDSDGYGYSDGTSYATPQVAATVAMMLSLNPSLTPAQILSRLKSRSTESVKGILTEKTYPLLNVGKSVALTDDTW